MLAYFFGKMPQEVFAKYCSDFSTEVLPSLIRSKAREEILKLKLAGAEVVVVSASPENWLHLWCQQMSVGCIATKLLVKEEKITGKINGYNCYGDEKVRRIKEEFDLSSFSSVYCYGDTPGDMPMLSLAHIRFYKPFR